MSGLTAIRSRFFSNSFRIRVRETGHRLIRTEGLSSRVKISTTRVLERFGCPKFGYRERKQVQ